jgi:DNA-binding transcriptional ArsR family regulator
VADGIVGDLADLIGFDAAMALIQAHAGQRLHVPKRARPNAVLAKIIGIDALTKLCAEYGGLDVYIRRERGQRVRLMRMQGHSYSEIARAVGLSQKQVHWHLHRAGLTNNQGIAAKAKARRDARARGRADIASASLAPQET